MSYFSVSAWSSATAYTIDDIVYLLSGSTRTYYYCVADNTNQTPPNTTYWTTNFVWKPSYPVENKIKPQTRVTKFGDGYEQRSADGISNNLLLLDYTFAARSDKETKAMLNFFNDKGGVDSFTMALYHPYDTSLTKKFIVRDWSHSWTDYNNNTVRALFEEVMEA